MYKYKKKKLVNLFQYQAKLIDDQSNKNINKRTKNILLIYVDMFGLFMTNTYYTQ